MYLFPICSRPFLPLLVTQSRRTSRPHSSPFTRTRYMYSVSAVNPDTQQKLVAVVDTLLTSAPELSNTSTRAGPYDAELAPIELFRGGWTSSRSLSSTNLKVA